MSELGKHLNIVFNESGDDPIVLESSWSDAANREHPNLTNVGQAKPRLRALCVLFILAKYRDRGFVDPNAALTFQVEIAKGTWICTIANDVAGVIDWIKDRFHIHDRELFLFASAGSTHNVGGMKYPLVEFFPKKLSLCNLNLYVKPANSPRTPARLLLDEELLPFAFEIESKHWKKSAIRKLHPDMFDEKGILTQRPSNARPGIMTPSDALFMACMADIPKEAGGPGVLERKNHFDLIFRILMEKEFDSYRENCKSFFSYVGNSLGSARIPYLWQGTTWNQRQIELLRDNCGFYANRSFEAVFALIDMDDVLPEEFTKPIWKDIDPCWHIVEAPFEIFNDLAYKSKLDTINLRDGWIIDGKSPFILEEAKESIRKLIWGFKNTDRSIAIGAFFVQQIILIDFLNEVCWPFYSPNPKIHNLTATSHLSRNILLLKREAANNRDLIYRFCNERKEFLNAAQSGRLLLKAQVGFYTALHRRLIALEG